MLVEAVALVKRRQSISLAGDRLSNPVKVNILGALVRRRSSGLSPLKCDDILIVGQWFGRILLSYILVLIAENRARRLSYRPRTLPYTWPCRWTGLRLTIDWSGGCLLPPTRLNTYPAVDFLPVSCAGTTQCVPCFIIFNQGRGMDGGGRAV